VLSACATSSPPQSSSGLSNNAAPSGFGQRDLTPQEKAVIVGAIAPSLKNAAAAKYRWAKFPTIIPAGGTVNYCGTVDAQSPYAAYSGRQAYVVEAKVTGGQVTSAVIGLIAGGKDTALVNKMCAKYGLDPDSAT